MSSGALKNLPKHKSGRAIALPAPPPPRSLYFVFVRLYKGSEPRPWRVDMRDPQVLSFWETDCVFPGIDFC